MQNEKGVIDGEERERDSVGYRIFLQRMELQYAGTRYPERIPIGTREARAGFDEASVRAFCANESVTTDAGSQRPSPPRNRCITSGESGISFPKPRTCSPPP